jgi:hypothetical protein
MKEHFFAVVSTRNPAAPFGPSGRLVQFLDRTDAVDEMLRLQKLRPQGEFCVMESVAGAREVAPGVLIEEPITDNG